MKLGFLVRATWLRRWPRGSSSTATRPWSARGTRQSWPSGCVRTPKAQIGSFSDAAAFGEVVVLAVRDRPRPTFCALRERNLDGSW